MRHGLTKYQGAKFYSSQWIVQNFPKNYQDLNFVDLFCGMCSVLARKEISKTEYLNDLDSDIYELLCEVKEFPQPLVKKLQSLEYSQAEFEKWEKLEYFTNGRDLATRTFVLNQMSRGGLGKEFSTSSRLRGGQNEGKNAWENCIKRIPKFSERLKNVLILNEDFRYLLGSRYIDSSWFFYADPPYLHSTRKCKKLYKHEMTESDHIDFLELCLASPAKILISGYDSELYSSYLKDWGKTTKQIVNHSGQNKVKNPRIEVLWRNYG
ncbi:MAG: DNA adenine methylase [Nitrososphaerales archaeon]